MKTNSDGFCLCQWCVGRCPRVPKRMRFALPHSGYLFFPGSFPPIFAGSHYFCSLFWHECSRQRKKRRIICFHHCCGPAAAAHRLRVRLRPPPNLNPNLNPLRSATFPSDTSFSPTRNRSAVSCSATSSPTSSSSPYTYHSSSSSRKPSAGSFSGLALLFHFCASRPKASHRRVVGGDMQMRSVYVIFEVFVSIQKFSVLITLMFWYNFQIFRPKTFPHFHHFSPPHPPA